MSAVAVRLPVEIPGEDVRFPPAAPVPVTAHVAFEGGLHPIPTWDSMTSAQHDEHREDCPHTCLWCEDHRGFGVCPACDRDNAEANDQGDSVCCGMPVYFPLPEEDGPERWD